MSIVQTISVHVDMQEQLQNVAARFKLMVLPVSNPFAPAGLSSSHLGPPRQDPGFVTAILARLEHLIEAKLW